MYQIYPRSFQDSNGDGVGDLGGIERRLDHLVELGVDALWTSPIYPSPMADFGYDVSDFCDVDPVFGSLADFDRLVGAAHERGLRVLMDLVPCHSSIEHPWFREHPDWYIWRDGRGPGEPPNNWIAAFGGSAWTWDDARGQWYLHSFYPEQPDLDWTNPELVAAMQGVVRFWLDRGVDGFRLDAIDRLGKDPDWRDDPPATEPAFFPSNAPDYAAMNPIHSKNTPEVATALAALREAAGDEFLIGEIYLPTSDWPKYLESLDCVFAFELFHAPRPWQAAVLREKIEQALAFDAPAWVFSNHDAPRLPTRIGRENVRVAAMLLLTLPGPAFVYQGDEIGLADGPGADPPYDRAGRDGCRHPMQWDASEHGGFTEPGVTPWLPAVDPAERNVTQQREDRGSLLSLYRALIAFRQQLHGGFEAVAADPGVLAYRRGDHLVALNLTGEARPLPAAGEVALETEAGALTGDRLAPRAGVVTRLG